MCIAPLDTYYSHRHYQLRFTHANLQHQGDDAQLRNCLNLIDNYTREEIETEFILDFLYTELQVQTTPDAQDALVTSVLEFLWKIGNCSNAYTTEAYQKKLQLYRGLQSQQSDFNNFVQGFLDQDYEKVRLVTNSVLF